MNLYYLKLVSIILILLVTFVAASYPFIRRFKHKRREEFPIGETLAAGVFLGAALLHMLGSSAREFYAQGVYYPWPFLLAGIAFLLLLLFEHLGRRLYEREGDDYPGFAILAVCLLSLHALLLGAALGLSNSLSLTLMILLAILAHKWAASFALAVQIYKSSLSNSKGIILFTVFALMTPLGIVLGGMVTNTLRNYPLAAPIFNALAAGTFLYLGTLHGLKRAVMVEKCCDLNHFKFVIIGFSIMAVVAIWA